MSFIQDPGTTSEQRRKGYIGSNGDYVRYYAEVKATMFDGKKVHCIDAEVRYQRGFIVVMGFKKSRQLVAVDEVLHMPEVKSVEFTPYPEEI